VDAAGSADSAEPARASEAGLDMLLYRLSLVATVASLKNKREVRQATERRRGEPGHPRAEPCVRQSTEHGTDWSVGQSLPGAALAGRVESPVTTAYLGINPFLANSTRGGEERGDLAIHGFVQRSKTAILDFVITDTDAPSYGHQPSKKVLEKAAKRKKDKYLEACRERRRDFIPMAYSVDGLAGKEARAAEKRLASLLASKWDRPYSEMACFVKTRMSLSIVRSISMLLRGSRSSAWKRRAPDDGVAARASVRHLSEVVGGTPLDLGIGQLWGHRPVQGPERCPRKNRSAQRQMPCGIPLEALLKGSSQSHYSGCAEKNGFSSAPLIYGLAGQYGPVGESRAQATAKIATARPRMASPFCTDSGPLPNACALI
ncbi:hypothetical protein THAOC_29349, partial [Thalassiosira oceanica]